MKTAEYERQVKQCADEIAAALPGLSERHTPLMVIAALTEHVSGALCIGRIEQTCPPERAKAIIERVRALALDESVSSDYV
jgi:hypothetical protein